MSSFRIHLSLAAAACALSLAGHAGAAQLLTNGDFEAGGGSTTGWTKTFVGPGNVNALTAADYALCCSTFGSQPAYSGNHFAEFGDGNVVATQTLSQGFNDLGTYHHYVLSFDLGAFGGGQNMVQIAADGFSQTLTAFSNNNADTTFQHYSYTFLGTGGHHTLSFKVTSLPGDNTDAILDNVSLKGDRPRGGVPEPTSWALMLTGFAGLGAMLRRRRAMLAA